MGQEHGEHVRGHLGCGLLDVVDAIEVRVVDAGQIDLLVAPPDQRVFVQEHLNTQALEVRDHANGVVVAHHAIDLSPESLQKAQHVAKAGLVGAECSSTIVPVRTHRS